jgi:hypothetical protein
LGFSTGPAYPYYRPPPVYYPRYLRSHAPNWPEIVDAADWLRHDLGVSKPLWGEACLAMGRETAAIALVKGDERQRVG